MPAESIPESERPSAPGRLRALFYTLAAILAAGFAAAIILAGYGIGGLGILTSPTAFMAGAVSIATLAVALVATYAFLPAILNDERRFAAQQANAARTAATQESQTALEAEQRHRESAIVDTDAAWRKGAQESDKAWRSELAAANKRSQEAQQGLAKDLSRQATAIAAAEANEKAMQKTIDAHAKSIDSLVHRVDAARKAHERATAELARNLDNLKHAHKTQGRRLNERIDEFENYVDLHESRHTILDAALAFDTEELAALQAKMETDPARGEPLSEIEGIGDRYLNALAQLGITDTEALRRANAHDLARRLRAFPGQIQTWQAMAELMRVPGIGPQYAAMLDENGIHSMRDLATADAVALEGRLEAAQSAAGESPLVGRRVEEWVQMAKRFVTA